MQSGTDPGFDEGGFRETPAEGCRLGPGACSPGKILILGPLKCDFQHFQGQFEVV